MISFFERFVNLRQWSRFKFCHDEKTDVLPTIPYVLVLREWSALQPSKEFRCFVKNNRLIGKLHVARSSQSTRLWILAITQRDGENYYPYIGQAADEIVASLVSFFRDHIQNKFPSTDFVVDIYRKESVSISVMFYCRRE